TSRIPCRDASARTRSTRPATRPQRASPSAAGVAATSGADRRPSTEILATATFVPPMSTAITSPITSSIRRGDYRGSARRLPTASGDTDDLPCGTGPRHGGAPQVASPDIEAPQATAFAQIAHDIVANVERVIQGKRRAIELVLLAILAEGHLLIEDVPGVGKTSLAKAIARSIDVSFGRVQFTPDLLPSDVVGMTVWNRQDSSFEFRPGPIFNGIMLGDEINRASPKTQSAL